MYTGAGITADGFGDGYSGLKVGDPADLVLLNADPTRVEEEGLKGIRAVMTIIGGQVAWEC